MNPYITKFKIGNADNSHLFKLSDVENELTETENRVSLYSTAQFQEQCLSRLQLENEQIPIHLISFDVFDTLLLRNNKCEIRRFWEIAEQCAEFLHSKKYTISTQEIFISRYMSTRISYKFSKAVHSCREGSLYEIYETLASFLNIQPNLVEHLIKIELDYEIQQLIVNPTVINILNVFKKKQLAPTIILISDMYIHQEHIRYLTDHIMGNDNFFDAIYSSADTKISKRSGLIFDFLREKYDVQPQNCIHLGDCLTGDFSKPLQKGWRALHLPISNTDLTARFEDMKQMERFLQTEGIELQDWISVQF